MNRYNRLPALVILLVATVLGVAYAWGWDRMERWFKKTPDPLSIEALEKKITAGDKSAATWLAYANALGDAKQYSSAANAYKQVLAIEPFKREARFQCGIMLAQADRADDFYEFQKSLVYSEAKLAVELFERPETQKFLSQERFKLLFAEAKNQAMD
jgi:hypothetical protein